jgi:hypothetical protein
MDDGISLMVRLIGCAEQSEAHQSRAMRLLASASALYYKIIQYQRVISQYFLTFNGSTFHMQGLESVSIPKADWVELHQVVLQPEEAENLKTLMSKIERY